MCTAITFQTRDHYFGRNLDLEYHYNEAITITPRNYPFSFRKAQALKKHYAMIGVATISQDYPLYYDAINEHGLSMAGLNFPKNAVYQPEAKNKDNITPFELIPWILGQCKNLQEAQTLLMRLNPLELPFSREFPLSPLHWIIADQQGCLTVEPRKQGLNIMDNPIGVLTNNPPFDYHLHNICNYINLSSNEPTNRFSMKISLEPYSRGMGAIGLPGDLSSASRFVRAAFTKLNSRCGVSENESVSQFFHILDSVAQQDGCAQVGSKYEKTIYSSCCNVDKGIFYYKTYENSRITSVSMYHEDLDSHKLIFYPMVHEQNILWVN